MFWLPLLVIGGGAVAAWRSSKVKGMTPARKKVYEGALRSLKDPGKLRALAAAFDKEGLKDEATLLRKRAALRELPEETKTKRKEVYRKAMASTNTEAVLKVAESFDKQGATGAAASLRKYANGLKKA